MISACCQVVVVFTTDEDILSFGRVDEVFASLPSCGGDSVCAFRVVRVLALLLDQEYRASTEPFCT